MGEPSAPPGAVGYRLALARELAGLTRRELAVRSELSTSMLTQVERGDTPASPSFTAATACSLRLDVETLYGQPYGPALCDPSADHAGVPTLRAALDCDEDPQPTGPAMTPAELRARLEECEQHRASARYAELATALPELLHHGHTLAHRARPGTDSETGCALLTDAYLLAQTVAYRFGYLDLAMLTILHARDSAERSGDRLRVAVAACEHSRLRCHRGDYPGVQRLAERAHTTITDQHSPAADAVRAALHLRQAINWARHGTADLADEHVELARDLIARGIPASPYHTVLATPASVDICWVAVAVELTDPTTALHRARQVKIPTGEPPALIGRHLIDLARAWALHGDHDQALDALHQARTHAPQLTRYHP
ncbi:MAG: helix-turn-helix domain-containing protein, partial [Pseudonocardiaceae bacterium]